MVSQVNIEKALALTGWMSERELTWLAESASKCKVIVEFGCYHGRSTRALADNSNGTIYAVDPWNGDYPNEFGEILPNVNTFVLPQFKRNLADHIITGRVIPCRAFSFGFNLPLGIKADMVFIDGDHRYESVVKDINKALSLLNDGGIIAGHDYGCPGWPGVEKAVLEKFGPVNIEDSIWWTRKS